MIKLSTFMLDPVKAHELYVKEVDLLKKELELAKETNKTLKKEFKKFKENSKEKHRQMVCQVKALEDK